MPDIDVKERPRKDPHTQLLESELRYRRLFESAKDGILILDAESGMVVDVNPYLIERLGFTREQFLGKAIWELGFFRDIVANKASFAELQSTDYVRYEDKPLETAAGQRIDVEFVSNVYLVEGERVIQCNIRDITAGKAASRQLREQNEILSNSHEGVVIVNLANQVSLWNPAVAKIFGWSAEKALGRSPEELLGLSDPEVSRMFLAAVERDGFWNGGLSAQARDGRKLTIDCRITLVRDERGAPRARLMFIADITEKKLLEDKFLRVQRLEAIGTLSSGIAHDLNNILAPMLMAAGLLREKMVHPDDREMLALIERSAQRGAHIIRQLLTFSRGIEGERVCVHLRHMIKEMANIVRETFPRNITLVERVPTELTEIIADATQMHQVLMNLCVNARDAMPAGGTLKIMAENVRLNRHDTLYGANAVDGPYVRFTVSDSGQGISRENINRIFDPFFTTKTLGQGTGLGLSTVLGIVRSHGGFLTVYSEPGIGSSFHVYIPAAPTGVIVAAESVDEVTVDGCGETILVVDDEPAIVAALRIGLVGHNFRVLTAINGHKGLEVFAANRSVIRIVVTDVMMAVVDGLAFARALRAIDSRVRVIASSGLDPAGMMGKIEAGFIAEFMSKPYSTATLLSAINRQRIELDRDRGSSA